MHLICRGWQAKAHAIRNMQSSTLLCHAAPVFCLILQQSVNVFQTDSDDDDAFCSCAVCVGVGCVCFVCVFTCGLATTGASYFFISLVLGPLNSLLWCVPSLRYIWSSAPISVSARTNKGHHHGIMCVCVKERVCVDYLSGRGLGETEAEQSRASVIERTERSEQGGTWSAAFLSRASHSLERSASLASTSLSCCLTFSKSSCPARNCICVTSSSLKRSFSLSFVSRSSPVCR
jgi:hypothetical protein